MGFLKKMKILIFFITLITIEITISLKQNEICKNSQQECRGKYNSMNLYHTECEPVKCHGSHNYKCNNIYCTTNAKSCNDFYNLNRPRTSMLKLPQRANSHSLYTNQIKDCKQKEYKLNHKDVCLTGNNCILYEKSTSKNAVFDLKSLIRKIPCPCKGKHNYHCGTNYCTVNGSVCDHLIKKKSVSNLQKCLNDNQSINFQKKKIIIV